jgi:hypothetical protein
MLSTPIRSSDALSEVTIPGVKKDQFIGFGMGSPVTTDGSYDRQRIARLLVLLRLAKPKEARY